MNAPVPQIPYARQEIDASDVEAVVAVLRSDWLTQGPAIARFEADVAAYVGARHTIAVSSATAALHLACLALDVGPGDLVWTVPNTFVASANCARYCGADVDFVDIDDMTWNLSVPVLERKLAEAQRTGRLPKVVIPVHFGGRPCGMDAIRALADRHGFRIIEDASHAIGATLDGKRVGHGAHADITVFSFHPVKIIATGEGGMLATADDALAERLRMLRTHGITRDAERLHDRAQGAWYYEQQMLGFNYRMTDLQAALGSSQLARIEDFLARRRHAVERYDRALAELPVTVPPFDGPALRSSWHLYVIRVDPARTGGRDRRHVFDAMRAAGVLVNVHYLPVHLQPYYRTLGFGPGLCPVAERYGAEAISLPMYASLTAVQQDAVVRALEDALA
jgi:UDP-4-amino-4,6-dideoxy-N-acetyl-beta-L-altrosamine transaminase